VSLGWVIAGTWLQASLAYMSFMLVAFAYGGIGNAHQLSPFQDAALGSGLVVLPLVCVACAGIVIYLYLRGSGAEAYWWNAASPAAVAVYIGYAAWVSGKAPRNG
jgi:hypothetical protein